MPTFTPPSRQLAAGVRGERGFSLWRYYTWESGQTVIRRADGSWVTKESPTTDELEAALAYYLGGHVYEVSAAEEADLIAGGFGAYIS